MSTFNESDHLRGGDGTFKNMTKPESHIALAAQSTAFTPEQATAHLNTILSILKPRNEYEIQQSYYYPIRNGLHDGSRTAVTEFTKLIEANHGGRCESHADMPAHNSPERWCTACQVALMVEGAVNPPAKPTVYGVPPKRPTSHWLKNSSATETDDPENDYASTTVIKKTGDEAFSSAVRKMFDAPADAEVVVTDETWEDRTNYTVESYSDITVECGGHTAVYSDMGAFMRALDTAERPDPIEMARRFMQATTANRPLLSGTAAVYLRQGDYSDPKPVFGKIFNVFSQSAEPSFEFQDMVGRRSYIDFRRVAAILETSGSGEYPESSEE